MYFTTDVRILFATRITRLFAYGFLSVVLALYLIEAGLSAWQIGMLLALTLAGDAAISLWLTTNADRIGRRRMLTVGAGLMLLAGIVFLITRNPLVLTAAAIVGVISPSGNEIGPFLSIEQAALSQPPASAPVAVAKEPARLYHANSLVRFSSATSWLRTKLCWPATHWPASHLQ